MWFESKKLTLKDAERGDGGHCVFKWILSGHFKPTLTFSYLSGVTIGTVQNLTGEWVECKLGVATRTVLVVWLPVLWAPKVAVTSRQQLYAVAAALAFLQ